MRGTRFGRGALAVLAFSVAVALGSTSGWAAPASAATADTTGCRSIPVDADGPLRSAEARRTFDVDGTGITVGVISSSFATAGAPASTAGEDVEKGLLPGPGNPCGRVDPVEVLVEGPAGAPDEGRAMLQNIHGIAPGARLLFAAAGTGQFTMADSIRKLADAGADVIVDDDTPFSEPFFQDGPLAAAVAEVHARGIVYLASAGNYTQTGSEGTPIAGKQFGSWATTSFRGAPCPAAVNAPAGADCLDFDPGPGVDTTQTFTLGGGGSPILVFGTSQPMPVDRPAIAPVMLDASGTLSTSFVSQPLGDESSNILGVDLSAAAGQSSLVIVRTDPSFTGAVKYFFKQAPDVTDVEYVDSVGADVVGPVTFGHSTAPDAISVGAAAWTSPTVPQGFSSIGPAKLLYAPWTGGAPAEPLAEPETRHGPDVLAVDDVQTSFFTPAADGLFRFFGTSSAAPSAAAVVALGLQRSPLSTPADVRAALTGSAQPVSSPYPGVAEADVTGAGLIDAVGFVDALVGEPPAPVTPAVLAATGASAPGQLAVAVLLALIGSALMALRASHRRALRTSAEG